MAHLCWALTPGNPIWPSQNYPINMVFPKDCLALDMLEGLTFVIAWSYLPLTRLLSGFKPIVNTFVNQDQAARVNRRTQVEDGKLEKSHASIPLLCCEDTTKWRSRPNSAH